MGMKSLDDMGHPSCSSSVATAPALPHAGKAVRVISRGDGRRRRHDAQTIIAPRRRKHNLPREGIIGQTERSRNLGVHAAPGHCILKQEMSLAARYTTSVFSHDEIAVRLSRAREEGAGLDSALSSLREKWQEWTTAMAAAQEVLCQVVEARGGRSVSRTLLTEPVAPVVEAPGESIIEPEPMPANSSPPVSEKEVPQELPQSESSAEDEQLLATLDEETANAIRVKRRMDGNRRSVREWLAEMRAAKSSPGRGQGKKSGWWS
jgi:hypothetical protein